MVSRRLAAGTARPPGRGVFIGWFGSSRVPRLPAELACLEVLGPVAGSPEPAGWVSGAVPRCSSWSPGLWPVVQWMPRPPQAI